VFDSALAEYSRRWKFKHPQPADFFRTIEDVSGRDLDWFWRGWFFTTGVLDQRLENVRTSVGTNGKINVMATIRNGGQLVMPVELKVGFADGSDTTFKFPVEIWYKGDTYVAQFQVDKQIVAAQINADNVLPDLNPANNTWRAAPTP
jgi:aminopeptidase N